MQTGARSSPVRGDEEVQEIVRRANRTAANVESVILGKEEVIEACVVAMLAGGHVIIEDYPGVGKTLLAKALARSVSCRSARIQFTPDLLPSDITGVSVFDQETSSFEFRHRIILSPDADTRHRAEEAVIARLLETVPIPGPER